ncbi:MAG TPA: tail fiber domain-containing protein, partial [Bacteroidia bacterium]|nr:tail fiber domain-containing protein [Bacteroidia bacterium]
SGVSGYVSGSSGAMNFSARFSGRVVSPEFVAQSDIRIKDIKGRSNSADDLKLLNTIQITDYEMKDKVLWGNTRFKKIIAQEVEAVYPQVVNKTTGFVPDIYATATISQSDSCFKLRLPADISINKDTKRIRIITNNGNRDMDFVSSPDARTLILKGELPEVKEGENVFVYGQEVNDFRVVDYEGLSTLNISATQELYKLLVKQQEEINALKKENGTLKTDLSAQMESLKLQMNAILYPVAKQ